MADYCTIEEIKAQLVESGLASTSEYDVSLSGLIASCSRLIDKEVGQYIDYFYPPTAEQTRYFDGDGSRFLRIDDAVSISSVYVAEQGVLTVYTLWSSSDYDYEVRPHNYAITGQPSLARQGGRACVVSLARTDPSFYGLPPDPDLRDERAVAEVLHEMGHLATLEHCPDRGFLMSFAGNIERVDTRGGRFCASCRERLPHWLRGPASMPDLV